MKPSGPAKNGSDSDARNSEQKNNIPTWTKEFDQAGYAGVFVGKHEHARPNKIGAVMPFPGCVTLWYVDVEEDLLPAPEEFGFRTRFRNSGRFYRRVFQSEDEAWDTFVSLCLPIFEREIERLRADGLNPFDAVFRAFLLQQGGRGLSSFCRRTELLNRCYQNQ